MPEQVATPAIEHTEAEVLPIPSPGSPPHKKTKYIEPENSLSVASILNEKPTTPSPADIPVPSMPHNTTTTLPSLAPSPLQVQLLSSTAKAPTRGSAHAAGYDIYASAATVVPCSGTRRALVSTAISVAVPEGTYGRVAPRSGLAAKHSIDVGAGVIDADYRGEVKVLLFNLGDADFEVNAGDRVAQLVLERVCTPEVLVVKKLEESVRGEGGFGSTGGFGMPVLPTVS